MRFVVTFIVALWCSIASAEYRTFRIGVSLPLSGLLAEYGVAIRNGIELARSDNPALFKNIDFIYEDNSYDPKKAVSTFQKFVDLDKVDEILMWGNEPALSVAPIAEQRKFPMIAVAQYGRISLNREYIIRFINTGDQYSDALLTYLRTQGYKNLAIVQAEFSFFNMLIDGLKLHATDERIEVIEKVLPTETDFRVTIAKLKRKKFDILGVYLVPPQVREFFKQAAELNFHPLTFGTTSFESKGVLGASWQFMNGAVFAHNAVTAQFRDRYVSQIGNDMQLAYAANAYDFATLSAKLFGSLTQKPSAEEILSSYANSGLQSGASGDYRFVKSGDGGKHFEFDIVVRKITGDTTEEMYRRRVTPNH